MQGLTAAYVRGGGARIDTEGKNITIAQSLLDGGGNGGLTKLGEGTLLLEGTNSYPGATLVSVGRLGGSGVFAGPVTVAANGTLAPGTAIGTLTVNNQLTLQGNTAVEISKDGGSPASDLITGVTTLNYGGVLTVTNIGATALAAGDSFNLFDASSFNGAFATLVLPPLPDGLTWDTTSLAVNGTIAVRIAVVNPPTLRRPVISGTELILSGSGGTPSGAYYLLVSTQVELPGANWTVIATNLFDANGNFSATNTINAAMPRQFFQLRLP
jgi:autotransporter-associated beta strand protein